MVLNALFNNGLYHGSKYTYPCILRVLLLPVIHSIFFQSHWWLSHMVTVETTLSSERWMNPVTATIINLWKAIGQARTKAAELKGLSNTCWTFVMKWIYINPLPDDKFRLFQNERVCRRQFQIWWKWKEVIQTGRKHCGKRRNCSLRAISPFPTVFLKGLFSRGVKRCHCVGMG